MMNKLALLAGVVAAMAFARPALAQGPFADVPTDHWAYDAVNELASRGIVNGYPDGTFGGKRALTRYEFAVAIQRMLQDIQRRIDAIKMPPPGLTEADVNRILDERLKDYATKADLDKLRAEVDQLRRLMTEFQDTLAALGTDVDQLKRDVAALAARLGALEQEVHKMPKITGMATTGFYGSYLSGASVDRLNASQAIAPGSATPTDIDNRPILDNNYWQNIRTIYDVDLGITAHLSDVATVKLLLNAGNYLGGYLNNSVTTVRDFGSTSFEEVKPYYLQIDMPISLGVGTGASVTMGKFGQQFTPYTLKLVDVDSYFYNEKTDQGNIPIVGGRINIKIGPVAVQAYAGQHDIDYAQLTSTAGSLFAGRLGDPLFVGNTNVPLVPPNAPLIDQSAGVHLSVGVPFKGRLGGTYIQATGTNGKPDFRRLDVTGADLSLEPFTWLHFAGEYARSQWWSQSGPATGNVHENDRVAWDGSVIFPHLIGKLQITGNYKRIGQAFDAPGAWGKIGRWFNPRGIEGYGGALTYPISKKIIWEAEGHKYTIIGSRDNEVEHWKVGSRYRMGSTNSVGLGTEQVKWKAATGSDNKEKYYNIGWSHEFNANTTLNLQYQYIDYSSGNFGGGGIVLPGYDYVGGVAVSQFIVRF